MIPWAIAALYLEAAQRVHPTDDAEEVLYVPTVQAETAPPAPVKPASARQSPTASDPVALPVPELEGQAVQATAEAEVALNVCTEQAATLLPAPVNPASARQSVSSSEPVVLPVVELLGQLPQASDDAAAALNVSMAHSETVLPEPVNPA